MLIPQRIDNICLKVNVTNMDRFEAIAGRHGIYWKGCVMSEDFVYYYDVRGQNWQNENRFFSELNGVAFTVRSWDSYDRDIERVIMG